MNGSQFSDLRRRIRELLAIPDRDRTDAEWDELNELEIRTAPGNRDVERSTERYSEKRSGAQGRRTNQQGQKHSAPKADPRPPQDVATGEGRVLKRQHRRFKRHPGGAGNNTGASENASGASTGTGGGNTPPQGNGGSDNT